MKRGRRKVITTDAGVEITIVKQGKLLKVTCRIPSPDGTGPGATRTTTVSCKSSKSDNAPDARKIFNQRNDGQVLAYLRRALPDDFIPS
jgi:hypothetical protein